MKDLIPFTGDRTTKKRLDEIFSRNMLGSVLVGAAAGKVVEKFLNIWFNSAVSLFFAWLSAFIVFIILFAKWEQIESKVEGDE